VFEDNMKKIFIVTGELSGDHLAAWYVNRLKKQHQNIIIDAVGGDSLKAVGAQLHQRFETLNVVGIIEIIKHLPRILRSLKKLSDHILAGNYDEVVLVDFPGFNLRLAKKLKAKNKDLKITYLSPPQLWCWGAWRITSLKRYCDRLIVLYPFEVDWYRQRGVIAEWLGSPVCERLASLVSPLQSHKQKIIAILPGSRQSEIETLLPKFLAIAQKVKQKHPEVKFMLPVAQSILQSTLESVAHDSGLSDVWKSVEIITGDKQKYQKLEQCSLAISKPGTITLELALLGVPTVVIYKTSWLSYFLARLVVQVKYMSLPNLLLDKEVFKEFIQYDCDPETLARHVSSLYQDFCVGEKDYHRILRDCCELNTLLSGKQI